MRSVKDDSYKLEDISSVVKDNVPDHAIIVGVPGKIIGWMCECGGRLKFDDSGLSQCKTCQRKYSKSGQLVKEIS